MPAKKSSPVAETVTATTVPSAPAVTKAKTQATGGAKKEKKVEEIAASLPVNTTTASVSTTPDVASTETDTKDDLSNGEVIINGLLEKVGALSNQIKAVQSALKMLAKEFDKQKKVIDKVQKKREKAKKSPSGFAKPCKISDELCDFIGVPKGSEQSRTDITRFINSYVKEHNLNNPQNRREFFPDKKLKAILNVKDGEKVTYFVLQRLIAHHFPPSMSKLAAAAKAS
jgi:chromatin remodeling complex protein RSC6